METTTVRGVYIGNVPGTASGLHKAVPLASVVMRLWRSVALCPGGEDLPTGS